MTGRFSVRERGAGGLQQGSGATEIGEVVEPHRSIGSSAVQHGIDAPRQPLEKQTPAIGKDGRIDPTKLPVLPGTLGASPHSGLRSRGSLRATLADPVSAAITGVHAGSWHRKGALLVTAKQVDALLASGDLSALDPHVPRALWPLVQAFAAALTPEGPLGSRGPLSSRGPVGNNAWNPSELFRGGGDWGRAAGSSLGPLGPFGPNAAWAKAMLPMFGPIAAQLQAGGIFGVLGPDGPLGPEGPLGYLGRVGGHGFAQNDQGEFVSKKGVERKTAVQYLGEKRSFELVELYREKDAAAVKKQDASWIIDGRIEDNEASGDSFRFSVKKGEELTLAIVPERLGDVFTLELFDKESKRLLARSDSDRFVNFIQAKSPISGEVTARVTLKSRAGKEPMTQYPIAAWIDTMFAPLFGAEINRKPSGAYRLVCA